MKAIRPKRKRILQVMAVGLIVLAIALAPLLPTGRAFAAGPSATPEGISMTYYADPFTTRGFAWSTDSSVTDSAAQIVEAGDATEPTEAMFESAAVITARATVTPSTVTSAGQYYCHKAHFTDLKPSTRYFWRVGSPAAYSTPSSFTTDAPSEELAFLHLTDAQETSEANYRLWGNVLEQAFLTQPQSKFVAFTGDLTNDSYSKIEMQQWVWALDQAPRLRENVIMPSAGNHESGGTSFASRFDIAYAGSLNTGGYYSFDYGNVHFITLNTNETGNFTNQYQWLENDLKANRCRWTVVQMHKGLVSTGDHTHDGDVKQLREQLMPLFAEHRVDLVLQGHDHVYTRSVPYFGGSDLNDKPYDGKTPNLEPTRRVETFGDDTRTFDVEPDGTYYVTINYSSTKQYPPVAYDTNLIFPATYDGITMSIQPKLPMFGAVRISGNRLVYDAYTVDGTTVKLFDSFAVVKDTFEETDALIAALPETPTVRDARAVSAAKNSYDGLTASARRRVGKGLADKLQAALQTVNLEAALPALEVMEQLDALTPVTTDAAFAARLKDAERAYYSLTEEAQQAVDNADVLERVQAEIIDRRFAEGVVALIADGQIRAARLAYDRLTDTQKAYVDNYQTLISLEATHAEKGCGSTLQTSSAAFAATLCAIAALLGIFLRRKRV